MIKPKNTKKYYEKYYHGTDYFSYSQIILDKFVYPFKTGGDDSEAGGRKAIWTMSDLSFSKSLYDVVLEIPYKTIKKYKHRIVNIGEWALIFDKIPLNRFTVKKLNKTICINDSLIDIIRNICDIDNGLYVKYKFIKNIDDYKKYEVKSI